MRETIEGYCKKLKLGTTIPENYLQIKADTHEEFLDAYVNRKFPQISIENSPSSS